MREETIASIEDSPALSEHFEWNAKLRATEHGDRTAIEALLPGVGARRRGAGPESC